MPLNVIGGLSSSVIDRADICMSHPKAKPRIWRNTQCVLGLFYLFALTACTESLLFALNSLARTDHFTAIEDLAYGEHRLNRLDIYLPDRNQALRATVVFFYGG